MSGARNEDRYGAHASAEQEIAHRYPPCDSISRVTDARAHAVPRVGTHSMGRASGSVSQRNGGVRGNLTFSTYAPPSLRGYVRIPEPTFLKPEAARSLFPPLTDRNYIFGICDGSKGPYFAPMCGRQRCAVSCDAFVLVGSSVYNHEFPDVAGGERPLASDQCKNDRDGKALTNHGHRTRPLQCKAR
jgi:hypothetical protein